MLRVTQLFYRTIIQNMSLNEICRTKNNHYIFQKSERDFAGHQQIYEKVQNLGLELGQNQDIEHLRNDWLEALEKVDQKKQQIHNALRNWNNVNDSLDEMLSWLRRVRATLSQKMPEDHDTLRSSLHECDDLAAAFIAAQGRLDLVRRDIAEVALNTSPEEMAVLNARSDLLEKQWTELKIQVEDRRYLVQDKLAKWTNWSQNVKETNDKMDEFQTRIMSVCKHSPCEEVLQRLEEGGDWREEANIIRDSVVDLQQQGRQLVLGAGDLRAADIEKKLLNLKERSEELEDHLCLRRRKLYDTVAAVQQLDNSMSRLKDWLSTVERRFTTPPSFTRPDSGELHKHLLDHTDAQRDLERHAAGIAAVLNLCSVLMNDTDACPTAAEMHSIQSVKMSLDSRWRNLCVLSTQRRLMLEQTGKNWQEFSSKLEVISNWLREAERTLANYIEPVGLHNLKDSTRRIEELQNELHSHLTNLDSLNRTYRNLAREGRTDSGKSLKAQIEVINSRWDDVQSQSKTAIRRLRYQTINHEEFKSCRQSLIAWLHTVRGRVSNTTGAQDLDMLQDIYKELEQQQAHIEQLDISLRSLLDVCQTADSERLKSLRDDVHTLCNRVFSQLQTVRGQASVVPPLSLELDPDISDEESITESVELADLTTRSDDFMRQYEQALDSVTSAISDADSILRSPTPIGDEACEVYNQAMSRCLEANNELRNREEEMRLQVGLEEINDGAHGQIDAIRANLNSINRVAEDKTARARRKRAQWCQLEEDTMKLDSWLDEIDITQDVPSNDVGSIQLANRSHRALLDSLEARKPVLLSLNILSEELIEQATPEASKRLKKRLLALNQRWQNATERAKRRQGQLQTALGESADIRRQVSSLVQWLRGAEEGVHACKPNSEDDQSTLTAKYGKLRHLRDDLERTQPRVLSLQDLVEQLADGNDDMANWQFRDLIGRLTTLLSLTSTYMSRVERSLDLPRSARRSTMSVALERRYGNTPDLLPRHVRNYSTVSNSL